MIFFGYLVFCVFYYLRNYILTTSLTVSKDALDFWEKNLKKSESEKCLEWNFTSIVAHVPGYWGNTTKTETYRFKCLYNTVNVYYNPKTGNHMNLMSELHTTLNICIYNLDLRIGWKRCSRVLNIFYLISKRKPRVGILSKIIPRYSWFCNNRNKRSLKK